MNRYPKIRKNGRLMRKSEIQIGAVIIAKIAIPSSANEVTPTERYLS